MSLLSARWLPGVIMPLAKIGKLKEKRFPRVEEEEDSTSSLIL